jgi:hypothetical protein
MYTWWEFFPAFTLAVVLIGAVFFPVSRGCPVLAVVVCGVFLACFAVIWLLWLPSELKLSPCRMTELDEVGASLQPGDRP